MRSENQGTMKERLILQFDKKRFKNKELLELGLELGFFLKKNFQFRNATDGQNAFYMSTFLVHKQC